MKFLNVLTMKGKVNVDATQIRIVFSFYLVFLDPYHNKSTQLALKEIQFYTMAHISIC